MRHNVLYKGWTYRADVYIDICVQNNVKEMLERHIHTCIYIYINKLKNIRILLQDREGVRPMMKKPATLLTTAKI